jgi:glycosyltransferase involved in cell wall biosynthesis
VTTTPAVALVVPCYNQGRFLADALESALAQSVPFAEIVVVDDGSTDDTRDVAARFPVRCLAQANRGLSAARNAGVRGTAGDFVVFLDADDRLRSNAVADGLDCHARNPDCSFVYGHFRNVADDGTPLDTPAFRPCPPDAYAGFLRHNLVGMHAAVMYRREPLLEACGFDETLAACEDYEMYLRLVRRGGRAASHERVVADYRRHAGNVSADERLMLRTVLQVLDAEQRFVRDDPARRAALDEGVGNWRSYYGRRLANRALAELQEPGQRRRGLSDLAVVLRSAPRSLRSAELNVPRMAVRRSMRFLPAALRRSLNRRWASLNYVPRPGSVSFGDLDRITPLSREFGFDRGLPIDRYYIDRFLAAHAAVVLGRVLEAGDPAYTNRYGAGRVQRADVVNVREMPGTTIVSDLTHGQGVETAAYDCVILTQTLHLIFDVRAAAATLHRILKPGGTLLLTVPGTISQVASDQWRSSWRWGFTALSLRETLQESFGEGSTTIVEYGNVLSSVAFLMGLAARELQPAQLDARDELYPLLVCARVTKAP